MKLTGAALFFWLFALFPGGTAFCARTSSAHFSDFSGIMSFGSGLGYSLNHAAESSVQEAAVSTHSSLSYDGRAGKLAFWPVPAPVSDLASVAASSDSLRVLWTAPPSDWFRSTGTARSYILRYTTSAPVSGDDDFRSAAEVAQNWTPLTAGAGEDRTIYGFNPGTTYYFSIEAVNEYGLISELSNPAAALALPPLPPINLKVATIGDSVAISWMAPAGYRSRLAFSDRFSPAYPREVKSYRLFRATAPVDAEWELVTEVSSDTFAWTDVVSYGLRYYYHVRALNLAGPSEPSYAMENLSGSLYFLAPDNESSLEIPAEAAGEFFTSSADPLEAYSIEISTHPEELSGRVLKSVEFSAYKGGLLRDELFKLAKPAALNLYYRKEGSEIVPSSALPDSKAISLYLYNGANWIQLYGKVDAAAKKIGLSTAHLGRYQIRSTERVDTFRADLSGLSNRLLTPNGDGKNDTMTFIFDNPSDGAVKGSIYDLKGALVAAMVKGDTAHSVVWDARSGGKVVPGGVYIYQIESGGHVYNGTVAVIK